MFTRYWICGDIHGSYLPIENFWKRNKNNFNFSSNTDCIILLGDVGLNYYNYGNGKKDCKIKNKLNEMPFSFFCIRGNHEPRVSVCADKYPNDWIFAPDAAEEIGKVYMQPEYSNIFYALDIPETYHIAEYNTLIIPGAYSVDKYYRLQNHWNWFLDEQLTENEMKEGIKLCIDNNWKFDLVLSHTCPIVYEPTDLFMSVVDQSTVDKSMERFLGQIEYNLKYKLWLWGHYHKFRVYPPFKERQCIMLSDGKEVLNLNEIMSDTFKIPKLY